jgi:Holliday junction resolvase RusA-like endonuclease
VGFTVTIPVPPSTNKLYGVGRQGQRYLTAGYRRWRNNAGYMVNGQHPKAITGRYRLFLRVPKTRKDVDNMMKATTDLLVFLKLTPDDRNCTESKVSIVPELDGYATVSVEEV